MVNLCDFVSTNQRFKKFKIDDLLFAEYTCLIHDPVGEIWSHNNYFGYVTGGKKMWQTRHSSCLVSDGESIFVKKGATTVHQYFEESFFVLFVFVPDSCIREVIQKHGILSNHRRTKMVDTIVPVALNDILENYFHSLLLYFKQPEPPPNSLLKTKLEELILTIISSGQNPGLSDYFLEIGSAAATDITEVMESHFRHPFSQGEFARLCARSLSSFKRDFKRIYGMPPGQWLLKKRLDHSQFLLKTSSGTIDQIATDSGFMNRSHFMKTFKERFGITPSKYKKANLSVSA
jgi:AraC-like DNA-binding protein